MLFVIYVDIIGNVAVQYSATDIIDEYNVTGIVDHPMRTLVHGLILQAKPLNLDTLQLFVALMAVFPLMLWSMLRRPNLTLAGSIALYVAARMFDWSLPCLPDGSWYFNPFCWQLLSVLGAWFAVNGTKLTAVAHRLDGVAHGGGRSTSPSRWSMTVAARVPALAGLVPDFASPFTPADKENLAALSRSCICSRWRCSSPISCRATGRRCAQDGCNRS